MGRRMKDGALKGYWGSLAALCKEERLWFGCSLLKPHCREYRF